MYSQQRHMRTNLSCCLDLIDNGHHKSANRLVVYVVLVPQERSHGIMRILENLCMLLPKALRMWAVKDTMAGQVGQAANYSGQDNSWRVSFNVGLKAQTVGPRMTRMSWLISVMRSSSRSSEFCPNCHDFCRFCKIIWVTTSCFERYGACSESPKELASCQFWQGRASQESGMEDPCIW